MDNTSQSDLDSHKRETDSREHQASCLHFLRGSSAVRWGIRRRVSYLPRKVKEVKPNMSLRGESESESKVRGSSSKKGMAESEVEERMLSEVTQLSGGKRKRDEGSSGANERKPKKIPSRWSVERCETSKKALLEVLREMDATWHKPVLRHELREKARKHIGDTGLLDYLLKHMAGEVFADGKERLIRRHNSEGAIEYWLELAELAELRQKAGISDPYWVPPPGWKLGDAISDCICDGHCKELIAQFNEEISFLKSEIAELKSLKQTVNCMEFISQFNEEINLLKSEIVEFKESVKSQQEEISLLEENDKRRKEKLSMEVKETNIAGFSGDKHSMQNKENGKQAAMPDDEVGALEKTVRKSAFRICQPEDTFLWPNMASAGGYSPCSESSAKSLPPQLIVLPSPTSPLAPPLPGFFYKQQPGNQRQVQSFCQTQSQAVLVQSPSLGMVHRPTAIHGSEGMMNSGANNRVECKASALETLTDMNSKKRDNVVTDLALASFNY